MSGPAFVKQCATFPAGAYGSGGIISGSFTPTNAGDLILALALDDSSTSTQTVTGTGTYGLISPPGQLQGNDVTGIALWANTNCTTAAQTCTLKSSATAHTGLGVILEFSGCNAALQGLTQGTALNNVSLNSPGTGVGAIVANLGIQVPTGAMLVAICLDSSAANVPSANTGTQVSSGSGAATAWCISTQAGTGAVITPSFTAGTGGGGDLYSMVWFVLYPPGIYVVQSAQGTEVTSGAISAALTGSVGVGKPIIFIVDGQTSGSNPFPLTVTDNVNSGNYGAALNSHYDATTNYFSAVYMKIATTAGIPTVSTTPGVAFAAAFATVCSLDGFVGTPTSDSTAAVFTFNGTASTTQSGTVSTGQSNELLFCGPWNSSAINSLPNGYIPFNTANLDDNYYSNNIPSAQAWNFSAPMGASSKTLTLFAGVYDATSSGVSISPSAGSVSFSGVSPTLNLGVSPSIGALSLSGLTPRLALGQVTPSTGAGSLSGLAPTILTPGAIAPGVGNLLISGLAASVNRGLSTSTGTLALTGLISPQELDVSPPVSGAIALTGYAVQIGGQTVLTVSSASISLTGGVEVLGLTVSVPAGSLTLSGSSPTISGKPLIGPGLLSLLGYAPSVLSPVSRVPSPAGLTLTGLPGSNGQMIAPSIGPLALGPGAVSLAYGIAPPNALILALGVPPAFASSEVQPASAAIVLTGSSPQLSQRVGPSRVPLELSGRVPHVHSHYELTQYLLPMPSAPPPLRLLQ